MSDLRIYTVDWVTERLTNGVPRWLVHKIDQDGNGSGYVFPKDTLEWRAAEYGLTDVDEILDMILHEPHLPDQPDRDDAAARVGLVTSASPDAEPITLFNAASTADALTSHRLRIDDAKQVRAQVRPPSKGKNPLDVIRANHGITASGLRAKRERVDIHRWQLLYGDLPVPVLSTALEVPRA
ncbi:hypothetical protein [Streptomyces sp. NPDC001530]|uniref:hypothetical protein n=1 Tax=Streptomyces sp. NPDC001530 TaxID=3364582 RepID=UPI003686187F